MFSELQGLSKEIYLKKQIDELIKIYRQVQIGLFAKIRDVSITEFQRYRAEQILKQVNEIIAGLDKKVLTWAKETMPYSYEQGIDLAAERLKALKATRFVAYDAQVHTSAVNVLINDVTAELLIANNSIKKTVNRYLLQTQQQFLQEKEINRMIAEGVIEGQTRREVSNKILNELKVKMNKQQFININGRNYRPDSYASLVARTRTREASSQAVVNTSLRYGVDLVQWDSHSEVCEYCQQFSGRVFSISGTDKDFPRLNEKPPLHPNSYDKNTEVYTNRGWVNIKDIVLEDLCLSLDMKTLDVEWTGINQLFKHYESKMVSFCNRNFDLLVTHNHNMVYITDWNHKYNKNKLQFIQADRLINKKSGSFYRSSKWVGEETKYFLGNKVVAPELYAEFMGWYLSEGSVITGRNAIAIAQSKKVNFDKFERIEELLKKLGYKYSKTSQGFYFYNTDLYNQLKVFGKSFQKFIPENIKSSCPEIIKVFLEAFVSGDGHIKQGKYWKNSKFNDEKVYFTSSKKMADDLGELILKIGKRPSFYLQKSKDKIIKFKNGSYKINHNLWVIRECYSQYASLCNMNIKEVEYNDFAYCVEIKKNNSLWVRRNGKTVWCGNCKCIISPITRENLEYRGYLNEVIKLSNAPSIKIDSFSRFEETIALL